MIPRPAGVGETSRGVRIRTRTRSWWHTLGRMQEVTAVTVSVPLILQSLGIGRLQGTNIKGSREPLTHGERTRETLGKSRRGRQMGETSAWPTPHRHCPSLYRRVPAGHVTVTVVLSLAEGVTVIVVVTSFRGATGGGVRLIEMQPTSRVDANSTALSCVNLECVPLVVMVMPPMTVPIGIRSVIAVALGGSPPPGIIVRVPIAIATPIGRGRIRGSWRIAPPLATAIIIMVAMAVPPSWVMRGLGRRRERGGQQQTRQG